MSSVGQAVGMALGGAVGIAFPVVGFALGASIGGAIGGMIDPPKGPNTVGPRLDDLSYQSSAFGVPLAHAYGTVPVLGNVFWLEGDKYKEVGKKTKTGGKGGSKATATTFTYYATFASSLFIVRDPAQTIKLRRLWIGSNLVYDATGTSLSSTLASHLGSVKFTFYDGRDPQTPHPRMQADKGAANVSGYPGLCYIVVEDLDLTPYSNSLEMAQVKCEVVVAGSPSETINYISSATYPSPIPFSGVRYVKNIPPSLYIEQAGISHSSVIDNDDNGLVRGVVFEHATAAIGSESVSQIEFYRPGAGFNQIATAVLSTYCSDRSVQAMMINLYGADHPQQLAIMESSGSVSYSTTGLYGIGFGRRCVIDGGATYILGYEQSGIPIHYFSNGNLVANVDNYSVSGAGVSENYLFVVKHDVSSPNVLTVYKLDRFSLALVETIVGNCQATRARIFVESDTVFWTASGEELTSARNLYRWENGAITNTYNSVIPAGVDQFKVFNPDELFVVSATYNSGTFAVDYYLSTLSISATAAKLRNIVTAECGFSRIDSSRLDLSALTNSDVRGFRVAQSSARAALEQLQAIFPFDVTISGYKLKFVSRGGSPVATIPESDLGAHVSGESVPILLPIAREMDSQIPATVKIKHLDPDREYDLGEQFASRPGTASVGERTVETGVVLNTTEAARAADVLNQKDWTERRDYGPFTLPPTYSHLEPTDVITVVHRGTSHALRLTNVEYLQDGRLQCSARLTAAQSYTSTATGTPPLVLGQAGVPLRGDTEVVFLDIPLIRHEQDVPSLLFGLYGRSSQWNGGALFRSDDNGNTYSVVGSNSVPVEIFTASNSLSSDAGYSIDVASTLTMVPFTPDADVFGVSIDQMFSDANLAAYGAPGRWEIIALGGVSYSSGVYSVKTMLRGLFGTEWASSQHVMGDKVVLIDQDSLVFSAVQKSLIGSSGIYRPVSSGQSIDDVADISNIYGGVNLKPLSPVNVRGYRELPSQDWIIEWDARSRDRVPLFSGFSPTNLDSPEKYVCRIYSGSTLIRELPQVSSTTARYVSADQVSDFTTNQESISVQVCEISPSIGYGYFSAANLSHYLNLDPLFSSVVFLLHCEGAEGGSTFTDVKGHTVTSVGVTTTTAAPMMGGASAHFNGSSYLSIPTFSGINVGAGEFSVEARIRPASVTSTVQTICGIWSDTSGAGFSWAFRIGTTGNIGFTWSTNGSNSFGVASGNNVITAGVENIVAVALASGVLYILVNGSIVYSGAFTDTIFSVDSSRHFEIGRDGAGNTNYFTGDMDEIRFTKARRITGAYTPSSTQFPDG